MKLSTALAVLIAIQRHGHRMMCVLASADDHERKLLINQDDAAKRVNDAVKLTMASVAAGDVHGVALPLNYVLLSSGLQQLTVALRLPGVNRDQHVLVDTGSSSLAFCNKSLAEEATDITKMDYAQCNNYGSLPHFCPDYPSFQFYSIFYVGQVFQGNIAAYNTNNGEEIASMYDVNFAIMDGEQIYTCSGPLDGIIGVAYNALNDAVKIPSPDFDASTLWKEYCESDGESVGICNTGNTTKIPLPSPLQQSLKVDVDSGYNSVEAFGLYCDYAATIGSKTDTIVHSLGAYFGGDVALNNTFYNSGTPQVATSPKCEELHEGIWYLLNLQSIRVPGLDNKTYPGFNQCENHCSGNCYTDSGASWIELPLPTSFCNNLTGNPDTLKEMGSMLLDLEGVNGSTITLSLPMLWLKERIARGSVRCSRDGLKGKFKLGLPIYQYYYLVYNMGNNTITFVDLPISNETQAFIDGPELGGFNEPSTSSEPSTGYRHTGSPGTNTFVMAGLLLVACKYIF